MAQQNDIVFRRIRGRIVPIKRKKTSYSDEYKKAASLAGGGALVSGLSGRGFAKTLQRAKAKRSAAFRLMNRTGGFLPESLQASRVVRLQKASKAFRVGGQIAGGALLSQGVQRFLRSQGVDDNDLAVSVGAEAGSQIASGIIAREANKVFGVKSKLPFKKIASGAKSVLKTIAKKKFKF